MKAASVIRNADGTPFSPIYGDVYHSADGGSAQSRHVFLFGNGLPGRWSRRRIFTIVEAGFGLGLNFLETWRAWRNDPERCQRLHFISVEKHPFDRSTLADLHADHHELAPFAAHLQAAWPELVPGMHRLHFESGRVTLTLVFSDIAAALPQLRCRADALFLDGFSPDRNVDMWTPEVMRWCARLAAPDATLATYTTARAVREGLEAAGFSTCRQPGFGRKRHMLAGARRLPPWMAPRPVPGVPDGTERRAIVIGAGIAGAAVCERLAARDWHVTLIERLPMPAGATSGMHAGIVHPHVSRDDCVLSRLVRNGFLYSLRRWQAMEYAGCGQSRQSCGVAHVARDDRDAARMLRALDAHGYPSSYAGYLDRDALGALCGCVVAHGGFWYPQGGWIQPRSLVAAQLAAAGVTARFGAEVDRLVRKGGAWHALAADGATLAHAPVVVLANGADATRLGPVGHPMLRVRGQLTYLPADRFPAIRSVVTGVGCILPPVSGIAVAGSTYDVDDPTPTPTPGGHSHNIAAVARMAPGSGVSGDSATPGGFVGFRTVAIDRLPLIGPIPDLDAIQAAPAALYGAHLDDIPRLPGLYGTCAYASRGLTWAAMGGELVASIIEGEPPPIEGCLIDAVDPARMILKRLRRRTYP